MTETISASLREHADGDVHIERLLGAVHAGARHRRRRRLMLASGAVVVIAAAALAGVRSVVASRAPAPVAGPSPAAFSPRPPVVEGARPVTDAAVELGGDPGRFHLDVDELGEWKDLSWSSWGGYEELAGTMESGAKMTIEAGRKPDGLTWRAGPRWAVTVGGQPAEAVAADGSYLVRWQPIPDVWAQVETTSDDVHLAIDIAERLRLDRVYRCTVPFRLTGIATARVVKCENDYWIGEDGFWSASGQAWFQFGDGWPEYQVAVGRGVPVVVNDTVDGRAVEVIRPTNGSPIDGSPASVQIRYSYDRWTAYFWAFGPADEGVVRSLVAAFVPVTDRDQNYWPSSPFE
jgi:hypothetical protein